MYESPASMARQPVSHIGCRAMLADVRVTSKHGTAADVAYRLWHQDSVTHLFKNTSLAQPKSKKLKKLFAAIEEGKQSQLTKYLKTGGDVGETDELGTPLLQLAVISGRMELVKLLLRNGADPNQFNRVGQTALAWAARSGRADMVDVLLWHNAKPNLTGAKYKLTPLIAAVYSQNPEITRQLLNAGASVATRDVVNNATALHYALSARDTASAMLMIEAGADYHEKALLHDQYSAYDLAEGYQLAGMLNFMKTKDLEMQKEQLLGAWKVHQIEYLLSDTTYTFNERDYGRFVFSKGHFALMYNPQMKARTPFQNLSAPTQQEIKYAFGTIAFNSGRYHLQNQRIITVPDLAKVPGFEGGEQQYAMELTGNQMTLVLDDETYPNGKKPVWYGKMKVRFLLKKEED